MEVFLGLTEFYKLIWLEAAYDFLLSKMFLGDFLAPDWLPAVIEKPFVSFGSMKLLFWLRLRISAK